MEQDLDRESLIWANYGFLANPFETRPLSLFSQSDLSVNNAYLPRAAAGELNPSEKLDLFLKSEGGGCVLVEGKIGVGKTSLVNHHRNEWRKAIPHPLFTPISEISAEKDWTKRQFLVDILSCLARTFITEFDEKTIANSQLLMEVISTTGTLYQSKSGTTYGFSIAGSGVQFGQGKATTIHKGEISNTQLEDYVRRVIAMCQTDGYRGVLIHLDNIEILLDKDEGACREFFDDIRDILQIENAYFVFVARSGFFQEVISPQERVRSIFYSTPVFVRPFTEDETIAVINKRYEVLAHGDRQFIKPVDDDLIRRLYRIHEGRIRNVLNDIKMLILEYSSPNRVGTLETSQAVDALRRLTEEKLNCLTAGQKKFMLGLPAEGFSNQTLVEETGKSKQGVNNMMSALKKYHFIQPVEGAEDHVYEVAPEFRILLQPKDPEQGKCVD
jgi:Cdc6-like AAA superfamily ATPase